MRIIAGEARGRRLFTPVDRSVRPPLDKIREAVFAVIGGAIEGRRVLDLFAGTGSVGLEAISRGARGALFVERSEDSLKILQRNIDVTGFRSRCQVLRGSALAIPDLASQESPSFALVFLDPPFDWFRDDGSSGPVLARVREILSSPAMEPGGHVILRVPAGYAKRTTVEGAKARRYGGSGVFFLTKPEAEE